MKKQFSFVESCHENFDQILINKKPSNNPDARYGSITSTESRIPIAYHNGKHNILLHGVTSPVVLYSTQNHHPRFLPCPAY